MSLTLDDILALKESVDTEFKKATGYDGIDAVSKEFWKTYSAFANTEGGDIYLGIEEKSGGILGVCGLKDVSKLRQDIFDLANNRQKISINLLNDTLVTEHLINDKKIIKVHVPKAQRRDRPVYVGDNPFKGSYLRQNEGDYPMNEAMVKKMLGEQRNESYDARILRGFTIEDLEQETLTAYRHTFSALKPTHPFVEQNLENFLTSVGAWGKDRETGTTGITLAGLLIFGKLRAILDEVPHYILDYQEKSDSLSENRWVDRFTTDGSWSGNLYDFYKRTYQKLTANLKVPFKLEGPTRLDQTPIHEALREALVNTIIHADYSGSISILAIKQSDMFYFSNPGLMRVPIEQALKGGDSDCRNRNLQKMFQLIGAAEQAGSGVLKIYQNWKQQHWRSPKIIEKREPEQTIFELHMASLLPDEAIEKLNTYFGNKFGNLQELERIILVTAETEGMVDHKRMCQISSVHPADITKAFGKLSREGFLHTMGTGRGAYYHISNLINSNEKVKPSDFNSEGLKSSSEGSELKSEGLGQDLNEFDIKEEEIGAYAKQRGKLSRSEIEELIESLCTVRPQSLEKLSLTLDRSAPYLRQALIKGLLKSKRIRLLYPETPNHPKQAYTIY